MCWLNWTVFTSTLDQIESKKCINEKNAIPNSSKYIVKIIILIFNVRVMCGSCAGHVRVMCGYLVK